MPPFQYKPLRRPTDIRIITVQGAPRIEDKLKIKLTHSPTNLLKSENQQNTALDGDFTATEPIKYEAVSYTWDEDDKEFVSVDVQYGKQRYLWSIRRSVETMIRHLRHQDDERALWIDALCINQEDDDRREAEGEESKERSISNRGGKWGRMKTAKRGEKAIQVNQMGTLYQKASCVLIWLGTDEKYGDGGAKTLSNLRDFNASPESLEKLLERRWFYRLWVIQEVALSRHALVMWGSKDDHNGALVTGKMNFKVFTRGLWMTLGDKKVSVEIAAVQSRLRAMCDNRNQSTVVALYEVLFRFQMAQCKDDRDRLFALNSLSRWPVEVDYDSDTDDIYTRYALKEVAVRLEFLNYAAAYALSTRASLLPSWVPDWRSTPMYSPLTIHKRPVRRCPPQRSPEIVGKYTLLVQGRIVNTIRDVQPHLSSAGLEKSIRLYYDMFLKTNNKANKDQLIDPMNTRFITTLTAGRQKFIPTDMINLLAKEGPAYESGVGNMKRLLALAHRKLTTKLYTKRVSEEEVVYWDGENERIPTWHEMAKHDLHYMKKCLEEVGLASQYPGVATIITSMWEKTTEEHLKLKTIPSIYFQDTFDSWYRPNQNYLFDRFRHVKPRAVCARTHLDNIWKKVALDTEPGSWGFESRLASLKNTIQEVMAERTWFTTESGELGICHPSAQPGDLIVTLPDAETPFIMRPWTDEELMNAVLKGMLKEEDLFYGKEAQKTRREYLRLVGDCYLYEYMEDNGHIGKDGVREIRIL